MRYEYFLESFCTGSVYLCPSKKGGSQEYIDIENCERIELNHVNANSCGNLKIEDLKTNNFSWVMTDDVSGCCFEVCSDESCESQTIQIGIKYGKNNCNVRERWSYWKIDFNILHLRRYDLIIENGLVGVPVDCSITCDFSDCNFHCNKMP